MTFPIIKSDDEASTAYDALSPEEHDRFWSMADAGADKKHALNLIRSSRAQDAVRGFDAKAGDFGPGGEVVRLGAGKDKVVPADPGTPSLGDKLRTAATNAGDMATGGGLSTLSALATSLPDFRPDWLKKNTVHFGQSDAPVDDVKAENAKVLEGMNESMPGAALAGKAVGALAPAAAAPLGAARAAAPSAMAGLRGGAAGGGIFGALSGLLNPQNHDVTDYLKNAATGGAAGAATGGVLGGLGGLLGKVHAQGGSGLMDALGMDAGEATRAPATLADQPGAPSATPAATAPSTGLPPIVKGLARLAGPKGSAAAHVVDALMKASGGGEGAPAGAGPAPFVTGVDEGSAVPGAVPQSGIPGLGDIKTGQGPIPAEVGLWPKTVPQQPLDLNGIKTGQGFIPADVGGMPEMPTEFPRTGAMQIPRGAGLNLQSANPALTSPSGIDIGHMGTSPSPDLALEQAVQGMQHGAGNVPDISEAPPQTPPMDLSFLGPSKPSAPPVVAPALPGHSPVPDMAGAAQEAGVTPPMGVTSPSMQAEIAALSPRTQTSASPFADTSTHQVASPPAGTAPVFRGEITPATPTEGDTLPHAIRFGGRYMVPGVSDQSAEFQFGGLNLRRPSLDEMPPDAFTTGPPTGSMRAPTPSHGAAQPSLFDTPAAGDETTQRSSPWDRHAGDAAIDELMAYNPDARDFLQSPQQFNPANRVNWQTAHDSTRASGDPMKGSMHGHLADHRPPRSGPATGFGGLQPIDPTEPNDFAELLRQLGVKPRG